MPIRPTHAVMTKPCGRDGCTTLIVSTPRGPAWFAKAIYCSRACRNAGEWRRNAQRSLAHAAKMQKAYFATAIARMVQRVKYLGRTEDERIVLAWRHGLAASKQRRYRQKLEARRSARREVA
jgi:hypothetical protein